MLVLAILSLQLKNQKKQRTDYFYLTEDEGEGHY